MKLVIQRVNYADVKIEGKEVGKINKGYATCGGATTQV